MQPALGMMVLFELLLLTCGNHYSSRTDKTVCLQARTCSRVHAANYVVLVSTYCRLGIATSVSESESAASSDLQITSNTATVQYKPVMSLARNNALAHYSHVAAIKYHMHHPTFMAFAGAAVILTSYPYTV